MRIALIVVLTICLGCGVAFAQAENTVTGNTEVADAESGIPNYTLQDEDVNGRPQRMDAGDRETAEELNAVERTIIKRDTFQSNRQLIKNQPGQ